MACDQQTKYKDNDKDIWGKSWHVISRQNIKTRTKTLTIVQFLIFSVTLACSVTGSPTPTVAWYQHSCPVQYHIHDNAKVPWGKATCRDHIQPWWPWRDMGSSSSSLSLGGKYFLSTSHSQRYFLSNSLWQASFVSLLRLIIVSTIIMNNHHPDADDQGDVGEYECKGEASGRHVSITTQVIVTPSIPHVFTSEKDLSISVHLTANASLITTSIQYCIHITINVNVLQSISL